MDKLLSQLTTDVADIFNKYDAQGTHHWTWETAAKDLPYQVGSLSKIVLQMKGERFAEEKTPEELKSQLADELADILAETLFIAHELNINLGEAWESMLASDQQKINERSQ